MPRIFLPILALLAALLSLFVAPAPAEAQVDEWRERPTAKFTLLYQAGDEAEAERYADFVDTIYEEIATAFSFRTEPPLSVRLYPTSEDYYLVNPAARNLPGVVAHADFRRRELVIIVERTAQQSEEEVRNNVRHELTHIVAADLSGNRLNTGFQEGIAQYLEKPTGELERRVAALRSVVDQGRLLPWSAFDERSQIYAAPEVGYPQTLSVVAFLIERDGFATFRNFLGLSGRSSGYRSALERAYGVSPATLEDEWRAWLPSYLAGGYTRNALNSYDLEFARDLLEQGNYAAAEVELEQATAWLRTNAATQQPAVLADADALLARASAGLQALRLAEAARAALEKGDYEAAQGQIAQARAAFAALGDNRQAEVLANYEQRIARGMQASATLIQASELARALRLPQARSAADAAADEFAALGDQLRLDNAIALRRSLDQRQRLLGAILLVAGMAGALLSLLGRFFQRPAEVW